MFNNIQSLVIRDLFVSSSPALISLPFLINGLTQFSENEPKALWQPPDYTFGIIWPIIYLSLFSMNFLLLQDKYIPLFFKDIIIKDTLFESMFQGLWLFNFRYKKEINGRTKNQYLYSMLSMIFLSLFSYIRIIKFTSFKTVSIFKYLYFYLPYLVWINFANILSIQLYIGYTKSKSLNSTF